MVHSPPERITNCAIVILTHMSLTPYAPTRYVMHTVTMGSLSTPGYGRKGDIACIRGRIGMVKGRYHRVVSRYV